MTELLREQRRPRHRDFCVHGGARRVSIGRVRVEGRHGGCWLGPPRSLALLPGGQLGALLLLVVLRFAVVVLLLVIVCLGHVEIILKADGVVQKLILVDLQTRDKKLSAFQSGGRIPSARSR